MPMLVAEAVKLIRDWGVAVAQAVRDLDVRENVSRKWVREAKGEPRRSPSHPQPVTTAGDLHHSATPQWGRQRTGRFWLTPCR